MTKVFPTTRLTAANDNPGGATSVQVPLSAFVAVIAKAYVAEARRLERSA